MGGTRTSVVGPVPVAGGDRREQAERAVAALNAPHAAGSAAAFVQQLGLL